MKRATYTLLLLGLGFIASSTKAAPAGSTPNPPSAIYAPQPDYPHVAYVNGWHGTGVFVMRIEIKSGRVKEAYAQRSTGYRELDAAAIATLKRWRFNPNVLPPITQILPHSKDPLATQDSLARIPVTFVIQ